MVVIGAFDAHLPQGTAEDACEKNAWQTFEPFQCFHDEQRIELERHIYDLRINRTRQAYLIGLLDQSDLQRITGVVLGEHH